MRAPSHAILWIRGSTEGGKPFADAALRYRETFPLTTRAILEEIGEKPSTDPELRALQLAPDRGLTVLEAWRESGMVVTR